jgi:hypothetical protein
MFGHAEYVRVQNVQIGKLIEVICEVVLKHLGALHRFACFRNFFASNYKRVALDDTEAHFLHIVHEKWIKKPQLISRENLFQNMDCCVVSEKGLFDFKRIFRSYVAVQGIEKPEQSGICGEVTEPCLQFSPTRYVDLVPGRI